MVNLGSSKNDIVKNIDHYDTGFLIRDNSIALDGFLAKIRPYCRNYDERRRYSPNFR